MYYLKQIQKISDILPVAMVVLTKHDREIVEIKWVKKNWTHNIFRVYEMFFGRRKGIRPEAAVGFDDNGRQVVQIFTYEAGIAHIEKSIRAWFSNLLERKWITIEVYSPQMVMTNGMTMPFPRMPYLFAIAWVADLGTGNAGGISTRALTSLSLSGTNLNVATGIRTETTSKTVTVMNWDDGSGGSAEALTQLGTYADAESNNHRLSIWYKAGPNTSNSRLTVTINANDTLGMSAIYYSGVAQSSVFTTVTQGGPTTYSSQSQLNTSDTNGSWQFGGSISGNGGWAFTSGGSARQILPSTGAFMDSNADIASGNTNTLTWGGGSTTSWITAMMRPAVAAGPANLKTYNTNLKANIKTANTNTLANMKSLDTNT